MVKVKYRGKGGYPIEARIANKVLVVGEEYEVSSVIVGGFYTEVFLKGVGTQLCFNHALFEKSPEIEGIISRGLGTYDV